MGVYYMVGCLDCKKVRDLDKYYSADRGCDIKSREDAISYIESIENDLFRAGLLVSFMAQHHGHNCVFFTCHDEIIRDKFFLDPATGFDYKNTSQIFDGDFWGPCVECGNV